MIEERNIARWFLYIFLALCYGIVGWLLYDVYWRWDQLFPPFVQ